MTLRALTVAQADEQGHERGSARPGEKVEVVLSQIAMNTAAATTAVVAVSSAEQSTTSKSASPTSPTSASVSTYWLSTACSPSFWSSPVL